MPILQIGAKFGIYNVATFIKDGLYNETYRLTDSEGKSYFMKLYDYKRMPECVRDSDKVREIEVYKNLIHRNIATYIDSGLYEKDGISYPYLVTVFFSGMLSSEVVDSKNLLPFGVALNIYKETLHALKYMHEERILHNDITPRNIIIEDMEGAISPKIIDFGHVSYTHQNLSLAMEDLEPFYRSPESFYGNFGVEGDIFSATAVFYALITGKAPWEKEISKEIFQDAKKLKQFVYNARKERLDLEDSFFPEWIRPIVEKGLALKVSNRFVSIALLLESLEARKIKEEKKSPEIIKTGKNVTEKICSPLLDGEIRVGGGFSDVAGMEDLKGMLQQKVIFLLKNPERASKYRLTPPNGMLLYGPPGCGKTYFAEKFAEESGFNFHFVKASDLGSIYVHGTQGKIAELFNKAESEAPAIICFDEFDAMVPSRQRLNHDGVAGEVNEFLSQLNNCAKKRIFVIGTTNQPDLIDNAVLRKGRLDLSIYIPEPDKQTRKLIFDINLKDRPCLDIDTSELAELTNKYVASDISFIVNDAAVIAALKDEPITQTDLINSINCTRPSLTEEVLAYYHNQMKIFSGDKSVLERPKIGFLAANK